MKYIKFLVLVICLVFLFADQQAMSQGKKKEMIQSKGSEKETPKQEEKTSESAVSTSEPKSEKDGKIFFSQEPIKKDVTGDETYIEEYELGKPLYARAFMNLPAERKGKISMRFTTEGQTFAEEDMREFWQGWDSRNQNVSSAGAVYFQSGNVAGIRLISEPKILDRYVWVDMYSLAEETFRMHLSRLKDKVKMGKTLTVKVEIFMTERYGKRDKDKDGEVVASGELKVKVGPSAKDLANMVCRCGDEGMKDAKLEKEISEGFKFGFKDHCAKVHQVVILDRDWQIVNDRRTGAVKGRFVGASVIWESKDGDYWVSRHNFWFPYDGSKFAVKAQLDQFIFKAPVPKLCSSK